VSYDLRAAKTGGAAFLAEPAAVGAQGAGRKRFNDRGKEINNTADKFAFAAIEMDAFGFLAPSGDPEYPLRLDFAGLGEQLGCDRNGAFEPGDIGFSIGPCNDPKDARARHIRLRTGTILLAAETHN
jgi:hypothetical protein